jgi:ABC-type transport system involved in cytochrome c biogenesis permease component
MTRSRVLWFLLVLPLVTPLLLAAFRENEGLTSEVWANSITVAAAIAAGNALIWGKRESEQ